MGGSMSYLFHEAPIDVERCAAKSTWDKADAVNQNGAKVVILSNLTILDICSDTLALFIDTTGKSNFVAPYAFCGTLVYYKSCKTIGIETWSCPNPVPFFSEIQEVGKVYPPRHAIKASEWHDIISEQLKCLYSAILANCIAKEDEKGLVAYCKFLKQCPTILSSCQDKSRPPQC